MEKQSVKPIEQLSAGLKLRSWTATLSVSGKGRHGCTPI
jgi:hypothetical protein